MKRSISLFLLIVVLVSVFTSCGAKKNYKEAISLIDAGDYAAAYEILTELGNYKDAKELLGNFRYVLDSEEYGYFTAEGVYNEGDKTEMTYNSDGLLVSFVRSDGKFEFTYDENKNLIKETQTRNGETWVNREYAYDENGNLIKEITFASNLPLYQWEYTYDERGNMTQKIERYSKYLEIASLDLRYTCDYVYDEKDRLIESAVTWSGGSKERVCYVYDENGRLIREEMPNESGAVLIAEYTYNGKGDPIKEAHTSYIIEWTYDDSGRLTRKQQHNAYKFSPIGVEYTYEYTYDEDGKLIHEAYDDDASFTIDYTYDESGNLIKKFKEVKERSGIHKYTYVYDAHGNIIEYRNEKVGGLTYVSKYTYKLVYVPYEIHESIEGLINPEPH